MRECQSLMARQASIRLFTFDSLGESIKDVARQWRGSRPGARAWSSAKWARRVEAGESGPH